MSKSAMQELIEWCNECLTDKNMSDGAKIALEVTIVRATDLLEKEKEQIIDAYENSINTILLLPSGIKSQKGSAEDYYNKTYNKN